MAVAPDLTSAAACFGIGGEMQIGEQHLVLSQHGALVQLRLFDLDDQVRGLEHLLGLRHDFCAGRLVIRIGHADTGSGIGFDDHFVTVMHEFAHTRRHHADAVFQNLDFLRYADLHCCCPPAPCCLWRAEYPGFGATVLRNQ